MQSVRSADRLGFLEVLLTSDKFVISAVYRFRAGCGNRATFLFDAMKFFVSQFKFIVLSCTVLIGSTMAAFVKLICSFFPRLNLVQLFPWSYSLVTIFDVLHLQFTCFIGPFSFITSDCSYF